MRLNELFRRYLIYGLSGPVIFLNLWMLGQLFIYFEGLITFTALSAILALVLDYLVRFLERLNLNRTQAILVVLVLFLLSLVTLGVTLIPIILDQATQLAQGLPSVLEAGDRNLKWLQDFLLQRNLKLDLAEITNQATAQIQGIIALLPGLAINTVGQIFSSVFLVVLAFYMLLYGDRFWNGLIQMFPPRFATAFNTSLQQQFHQFFLTQVLLALVMVIFLLPTFLIINVQFSLLFTLLIGLFEIIPLFGATIGIGIVCLLALGLQGWFTAVKILVACIIFQQITDNIIAPRIRGDFTGLNPIWIVISLLVGGRVAGFIGVVLAMPIAATIKSTHEAMRQMAKEERLLKTELKGE
jgi:predicted PurR-regulated permease PerM